ncbi:hypothetical protein [Desulfosporosinus sp. BG]|uniref:hypothetical protein n=1 Tax=Desulfosporosinus sp. BG TaxID=1633135 RepID=UPI00083AD01C|nr:hypothetical protein [Desulfosporosinus sp. BG]ODA39995.1 hypothetical protein DSBG_3201 [Desulfosporosinus sp. BG]
MYTLDAQQQNKVLDSFQRVVDKRDSSLICEDLYNHLNLNCNFISHLSLQGFREYYYGDNFQEFFEQFDRRSPHSQWREAPGISRKFEDLNEALIDYASSQDLIL